MRKVPVYFDPAIELIDIMLAARHIGCTLTGTPDGALLVAPAPATPAGPPPDNVIPLRRRAASCD